MTVKTYIFKSANKIQSKSQFPEIWLCFNSSKQRLFLTHTTSLIHLETTLILETNNSLISYLICSAISWERFMTAGYFGVLVSDPWLQNQFTQVELRSLKSSVRFFEFLVDLIFSFDFAENWGFCSSRQWGGRTAAVWGWRSCRRRCRGWNMSERFCRRKRELRSSKMPIRIWMLMSISNSFSG